jgi:protein-tyrosine phosphatase
MQFIDIHSHVLWGLDDGARTRDDSVAMLELAARHGTTDIVASPHANSRFRYDAAVVDARIAELQPLTPVRIHRGADFRLQADTIEDAIAHPSKYSIDGGRCLLVEFPEPLMFANSDEVLGRLVDAGLSPIVTHPERHPVLGRRPDAIARWIDMGCYVQVTAGSVTGQFGQSAQAVAGVLFARGLVHFVASDAHDTRRRPPTLTDAWRELSGAFGEDAVRPLFLDNPRAVLMGETIEAEPRPLKRRRRRWYRFW